MRKRQWQKRQGGDHSRSADRPGELVANGGDRRGTEVPPGNQRGLKSGCRLDATKAYQIASTLLKQEPEICGIVGFWDVSDAGIASAVKEAGLQDKVAVITSGSGARDSACDKIETGDFAVYTSYSAAGQGRDLNGIIRMLLQTRPEPGSESFDLVSPLIRITKDTMTPSSCWTLEELQQIGG